MEFLSDAYQKSVKYRNAVSKLPGGWETLVTLNYMILQYGVREWQQDRMEPIIQEMKKRKGYIISASIPTYTNKLEKSIFISSLQDLKINLLIMLLLV